MYNAYITELKNVRPHPNADRLLLADCFGNTVCVGLDYKDGELGIYFPTGGQLSEQFCEFNNLVRKKDDAGNNIGGYLDPNKRNITAIKLRNEKSDGLFMRLDCLAYTGADLKSFKPGDVINVVNGHEICVKYIPKTNPSRVGRGKEGNKTRKKKVAVAPLFSEHADTEQLAYNLNAFKPGDEVEITLKMHGTSQRTGYLPVFKGYKRTLMDRLFRREGTPIYGWGYVSGTRRTVLEDFTGGYYGSNEFREPHSKHFEGKLWKGETVYYEVVGYTTSGSPIMGTGKNEKLGKDFVKQYGKETVFSYGCEPGASDMYVYRMTMTNEDGNVVEYTPEFMRYRCELMGVKTVPVFWKGQIPLHPGSKTDPTISAGEWIKNKAEMFYEGTDPVGKTHIKEGVVVRLLNKPKFSAYKLKSFEFRVLEGIISDAMLAQNTEVSDDIASEM